MKAEEGYKDQYILEDENEAVPNNSPEIVEQESLNEIHSKEKKELLLEEEEQSLEDSQMLKMDDKERVEEQFIEKKTKNRQTIEIQDKEIQDGCRIKENQDTKKQTKKKSELDEQVVKESLKVEHNENKTEKLLKNRRIQNFQEDQQDQASQNKLTTNFSNNHVQTLSNKFHSHSTKPTVKQWDFSSVSSDLHDEIHRVLRSDYQGDTTSINQFIRKINKQIHSNEILDTKVYDMLTTLGTDEKYPNLVMIYKKDGEKSLELLDPNLYEKLLEHQKLGNFRLEWQRFWFEGLGNIKPSQKYRKMFLLDSTGDQNLPPDMRRIWAVKNSYTWNIKTPTKRELHSKSIKSFFGTLFGERPKFSDFRDVRDYTYQKKMNYVWEKIQEKFGSEIGLRTTRRPAIFPLKREHMREKIEHALIGTFWNYYNSLDRVGKRNLKGWGYNNLLKFMEKEADGVYRTVVDPNYIGQRFMVRVTNKGKAFSKFCERLKELRESDILGSKYAINKIYREWILNSEIFLSTDLNGFIWTVDKARQRRMIVFRDINDLMNENNAYGIGTVLEALFENKKFIKILNRTSGRKFSTKMTCSPSGQARINTDATSIAYPDLTITQPDGKPVYVQIKDLGKCFDQEKEALVLVDQLKSLFGSSDNFENITIHVINALDIRDVIDPNQQLNLGIHKGTNFGLINIGIWENIEGINKLGEIFSALRTLHDAGYSGNDAIERVLDYIKQVHPVVNPDDVRL